MTNQPQYELINLLKPDQLENYLISQEWVESGSISNVANIWHRPEPEYQEYEIIQPKSVDLKDYYRRVRDLIYVLSDFEEREFSDVANDVNNFHADVIKIRVVHEDVKGGSIPLSDGVRLFEKTKELLISSARSTFSSRKYFIGGKVSDEVSEYLDNVLLGQTEIGSYVVNVISPLIKPSDDHTESSDKNLPTVPEKSVARAVTENLARSLSAITKSITDYQKTQELSSFDGAVNYGVSANLCDALLGLSGDTKTRDVNINISLSKSEQQDEAIQHEHTFTTDAVPYLKKASLYYKTNTIKKNAIIRGFVIRLSHEETDDFGTVTVETMLDDVRKKVTIELPMDDYWKAHSAHRKSQPVQCFGHLFISPRSAKLIDPDGFRIFGMTDMFDND